MTPIFDQFFPTGEFTFEYPREQARIVLLDIEPHPIKQWNREHKWCWCPQCAMTNPRGARVKVDMGTKHCGHCAALLFRATDSQALTIAVPKEFPWFIRLNSGPRGTGWYRRKSIELLYGHH